MNERLNLHRAVGLNGRALCLFLSYAVAGGARGGKLAPPLLAALLCSALVQRTATSAGKGGGCVPTTGLQRVAGEGDHLTFAEPSRVAHAARAAARHTEWNASVTQREPQRNADHARIGAVLMPVPRENSELRGFWNFEDEGFGSQWDFAVVYKEDSLWDRPGNKRTDFIPG